MDIQEEAKALAVKIVKEGDEWCAVFPDPDSPKEDLGLPADTPEDAIAEARAYRAIQHSSLYKFAYDPDEDIYRVSLGPDEHHEHQSLAEAYKQAQEAYAERIKPEPPAPKPEPEAPRKRGRPPKAKAQAGNGEEKQALPDPEVVAEQLTAAAEKAEKAGERVALSPDMLHTLADLFEDMANKLRKGA